MRDDVSRKSEWVRGSEEKWPASMHGVDFDSDSGSGPMMHSNTSLSFSHLYLLFLSLKHFTFYSHSSRASNWLMIIISHSTHQNKQISIFFNSLTFEAKFKPLENQREWTSNMSKFEGEKKRMESGEKDWMEGMERSWGWLSWVESLEPGFKNDWLTDSEGIWFLLLLLSFLVRERED